MTGDRGRLPWPVRQRMEARERAERARATREAAETAAHARPGPRRRKPRPVPSDEAEAMTAARDRAVALNSRIRVSRRDGSWWVESGGQRARAGSWAAAMAFAALLAEGTR